MGDWPGRPSAETRKRLDAALNEILAYGADELAPGWEIVISMTGCEDEDGGPGNGDASITLIDPDGVERSSDWDTEQTNIWTMVDVSRNPDEINIALSRDDDE